LKGSPPHPGFTNCVRGASSGNSIHKNIWAKLSDLPTTRISFHLIGKGTLTAFRVALRKSSKTEEMQLPPDTYEGWLRTQHVHHPAGVPKGTPAKDSYESWLGIRVEKHKTKSADRN